MRSVIPPEHYSPFERRLQKSRAAIEDRASEGMFRIGIDGKVLSANAAMARMLGSDSASELVESLNNRKYLLFVDPAERASLASTIARRRRVSGCECRLYRVDGSVLWVRGSARAVLGRKAEGSECEAR